MASADSSHPPPPYWLLIAVLSSSLPLRPEVSLRLYQAAFRLHRSGETVERLQGDLLRGKVVRLHKDLAIGSVVGPAFEAEISTEAGEGVVHFLLTRQGLEQGEEDAASGQMQPELPLPSRGGKWLN